jgi:ribosomal protein S18 acetylase RimI-like enzyme
MFSIRPYQSSDKQHIIELFLLNTPAYFHPQEQQDLDEFLDTEIENYFVVEGDGAIIASGGSNVEGDIGWLSWYIVHPTYQGKGAGSMLVNENLKLLTAHPDVKRLAVRTSQMAYQFYLKFGYQVTDNQDNFWGDGFHLVEMVKKYSRMNGTS